MKKSLNSTMASTFALQSQEPSQKGNVFFHSRQNSLVLNTFGQTQTRRASPNETMATTGFLPPQKLQLLSHRGPHPQELSFKDLEPQPLSHRDPEPQPLSHRDHVPPKQILRRQPITSSQRTVYKNGILSYTGIFQSKKHNPAKMNKKEKAEFLFQLIQDCYAAPQKSQIYQRMMEIMKMMVPVVYFPVFKAIVRKGAIKLPQDIDTLTKHLELFGNIKRTVLQKINERKEEIAALGNSAFPFRFQTSRVQSADPPGN